MRCWHSPIDLRKALPQRRVVRASCLALAFVIGSATLVFAQRYPDDVDLAAPPVAYHGLVINSQGKPVSGVEVTSEAARNEVPWGMRLEPARAVCGRKADAHRPARPL